MGKPDKKFYMVREDILPESILKTALASIMATVDRLEMSRSTFYKYKDGIYSFFNAENLNIINVSMMLKNTPGVLSSILNRVAQLGANVLTINQNLPIHGAAYVTISLSVEELNVSVDDMLREFKKVDGVLGAEIVGKS